MKPEELEKLIQRHYHITGTVEAIEGYSNLNYKLVSDEGDKYVVKIFKDVQAAELQIRALLTLADSPLAGKVPKPIPTGSRSDVTILDNGQCLFLLSWLEGQFFKDTCVSEQFAENLGRFLATLNETLQMVDVPSKGAEMFPWDLRNYRIAQGYTNSISDRQTRLVVEYFFSQVDSKIEALNTLPFAVIHGDANDWNVLGSGDQVMGIIDFGDMCYTWRINEIAIACAYLAMYTDQPQSVISSCIDGYNQIVPLNAEEIDHLYLLIALRLCVSVAMSSYQAQSIGHDTYILTSQKKAIDLLHKWLKTSPISATQAYCKACGFDFEQGLGTATGLAKRAKYIGGALSLSYRTPITMEKAALQYMYDSDGKTYLDCVNNICHVGHANPLVLKASKQGADLNTNTRYHYPLLTEYSERLCSLFNNRLTKVFFVNSGSAASDLAIRIAKCHTKRHEMVALQHGYHGNTQSAIGVSSYKYNGRGGEGKPAQTIEIPLPVHPEESFDSACLNGKQPAALIAESIVGCGGQRVLPKTWIQAIYSEVRERGGLCIADEVQTGFGRVGNAWWAYEELDLDPDIVVIGKPMGNGHPMAAVVTTSEIAASFNNGMEFFSSFGGNPVSCAIGLAVIESIEVYQLKSNACDVGVYFKDRLGRLKSQFACVSDVRGSGLFLGVEFMLDHQPATELVAEIINDMKARGILLSSDGPENNVIKIKPPLCFNKANVDEVCEALERVLRHLSSNLYP